MVSFLEYLKEYNRRLKEDAVLAGSLGDGAGTNGGGEITSPADVPTNVDSGEVSKPSSAPPMSDNSVLGRPKDRKKGFFGPHDFIIPTQVLSGDYEIEKPKQVK